MLDHSEVLEMHDEAWTGSENTRERAADDLLFARVTQWDDPYLNTQLEYRGQFDMIRKARRHSLSEMRANPVQVNYVAGAGGDDDTADLLDKKYRFDMSSPSAKQAAIIAQQDQLDCGMGAWRIVTDYENSLTNEQYIKRQPIHEANNRVFYDPNCVEINRSDAEYCSIIWTITELGWDKFAKEIGVDPDEKPTSFRPPEDSHTFPWIYENSFVNIGEFYHRVKVSKKAYLFTRFDGAETLVKEEDSDDVADKLMEDGYTFTEERDYDTHEVWLYWCSGGGFLGEPELVAGTEIPVVSIYGETSKVENQWVWEGIVRQAKDPQRLRNFMLSYIADIAAKGARQRPYFGMSQIQGLEWQFDEGGADQNRAFRVLNDVDDDGNPIPAAPISYEQPPEMPQAAIGLLDAVNGSIVDNTAAGVPMETASLKNMAEGTIEAINDRADSQFYTYLDNYALSLQREAEIYAGMVPIIYDTPKEVGLLAEDGSESVETINNTIVDWAKNKVVKVYDMTQGQYRVRTKVTAAYTTRKDKERAELTALMDKTQDPQMQNIIMLNLLQASDSTSESLKKYSRNQLITMGIEEAESDEEKAMVEQLQNQPEQPDAMMVAAQAAMKEAENKGQSIQVDRLNAQTKSREVDIKGQDLQVKTAKTSGDMQSQQIDNQGKVLDNQQTQLENVLLTQEIVDGALKEKLAGMPTMDLIKIAGAQRGQSQ